MEEWHGPHPCQLVIVLGRCGRSEERKRKLNYHHETRMGNGKGRREAHIIIQLKKAVTAHVIIYTDKKYNTHGEGNQRKKNAEELLRSTCLSTL